MANPVDAIRPPIHKRYPRAIIAFLGALVLLVAAAAAYANPAAWSQLFSRTDDGLKYIELANLGQPIHLSEKTGDYTITLEQVYNDPGRLVVAFTVQAPGLTNDFTPAVSVTTPQGERFPALTVRSSAVQGYSRAFVASFAAITPADPRHSLHLLVEPGTSTLATEANVAQNHTDWQSIAEAVTFDIQLSHEIVPRVADLDEVAQSAGVTLLLEQVKVSPSGAYAILCTPPGTRWLASGSLTSGAGSKDQVQSEATPGTEGCHTLSFLAPHYYDQGGKWTLTVTELVLPNHEQGQDEQLQGTWMFTFEVPSP